MSTAAETPAAAQAFARLPDWQLRLSALVGERLRAPFVWGANDCCLFAADAVQAIVGHDFAAPWRGSYADATSAAALLQRLGGLRALATAMLGPEIPVRMARPGDVVLMGAGMGMEAECLGICNGATAVGPSARGLAARAMADAVTAWRVGRA